MKWALVLHFYQPPAQDLGITKQILESVYLPVLRLLRDNPRVRLTVNISACLLKQLHKLQRWEFFELVKHLTSRGRVELMSSPAYHPVLPLVKKSDFDLQMLEAEWIYYDTLGFLPGKGFFFPELAVDEECVGWIGSDHYAHTVVDRGAVGEGVSGGTVGGKKVFVNERTLTDLIRAYPRRLSARSLREWLLKRRGDFVVSVNDVEIFGHHYEERLQVIRDLFKDEDLEFVRLDSLVDWVPDRQLQIRPSSWQEANGLAGPFDLWADKNNFLQQGYLEIAGLAREALWQGKQATEPLTWDLAAGFFSAGLSSCYLYWLSQWPWWHPELAQRGAEQLIRSLRSLKIDKEVKVEGEKMYHAWLTRLWERHWSGEVEKVCEKFDAVRSEYLSRMPNLD